MISLLIDTCTSNLIVAICRNNDVLYKVIQRNDSNLSTNFTFIVKEAIEKSGVTIEEIKKIYVANGPGSFTGIRIGVTFAKVFAWSRHIKLVPFSSLELMASSCENDYIISLLDARRGYVYAGIYDNNLNSILPDEYVKLDEFMEKTKGYNNISFVSCDECAINAVFPNYNIGNIIKKHDKDSGINPHSLVPNYLKKTEAEEKLAVKND